MNSIHMSLRRLADFGVRVVLVRDDQKRRFRLYQQLDYDRDGVYGEKLLRDWSLLNDLPPFLEGMLVALTLRKPTPGAGEAAA